MITEKEMFVEVTKTVTGSWFDPTSRLWFKPNSGIIPIPIGTDITNVNRYLDLNYLEDKTPATLKKNVVPPEVERFTPGQILAIKDHEPLTKEVVKEEVVDIVIEVTEEEDTALDVENAEETQVDSNQPELTTPTNNESDSENLDDEESIDSEGGVIATTDKVACQYCGKEYSPRGIKTHEKACKSKPEEE